MLNLNLLFVCLGATTGGTQRLLVLHSKVTGGRLGDHMRWSSNLDWPHARQTHYLLSPLNLNC